MSCRSDFIVIIITLIVINGQPPQDSKFCFQGITRKPADCCPLPPLIQKDIVDECREKHPTKFAPGSKRTEGSCIAECVLRKINAFDAGSNTLDKEKIGKAILETAGNDEDFMPMLNKIVDICILSVSQNPIFLTHPNSSVPGRAGCSFVPQALINCIKTEMFTNCPSSRWFDASECGQLKQKLLAGCSFASVIG
ncbi:general odorant-binding protein 67-like [Malaya genurostris]|uniref:general odorant-binding protein 67-like n=1 Tax=Malaya genurostris TaxID=325434 RepID=UPI0026F3F782|nr:general odorant-binding protein 67-like [Malaya genurostris]